MHAAVPVAHDDGHVARIGDLLDDRTAWGGAAEVGDVAGVALLGDGDGQRDLVVGLAVEGAVDDAAPLTARSRARTAEILATEAHACASRVPPNHHHRRNPRLGRPPRCTRRGRAEQHIDADLSTDSEATRCGSVPALGVDQRPSGWLELSRIAPLLSPRIVRNT
jgi:hypothetical protein